MYEKDKPSPNYICEEMLPNCFPLVTPAVAAKLCDHVEGVLAKFRQELLDKMDDDDLQLCNHLSPKIE